MSDDEKRSMTGAMAWDQIAAIAGRGDSQSQRQALVRLMATMEAIPCFDGQNLVDTDHPGMRYDSATDSYIQLTQSNIALATTWNPTSIETMVKAMTSYHDESGNHYGNVFEERDMELPTTNDLRTQASRMPQFHVWAGSNAIDNVQAEHRTWNNSASKFAGSYTYNKVDELPENRIVVCWLNNSSTLPGTPEGMMRPFLRKHDGVQIYTAENGAHLDNQRYRMSEINAHSDFGFGAHMWAGTYMIEQPPP
jgi:phage major head subunit gpT-like protein